jgi:hypothetical protein
VIKTFDSVQSRAIRLVYKSRIGRGKRGGVIKTEERHYYVHSCTNAKEYYCFG